MRVQVKHDVYNRYVYYIRPNEWVVYTHPVSRSGPDNGLQPFSPDKSLLSHAGAILFLAAYDLMLYHYYYNYYYYCCVSSTRTLQPSLETCAATKLFGPLLIFASVLLYYCSEQITPSYIPNPENR